MNNPVIGQEILRTELKRRKDANPSYSLRAFSRDLEIDKTTLSDYLNGERSVSKKNILKLKSALNLDIGITSELEKEYRLYRNRVINNIDYTVIKDDDLILYKDWINIAIITLCDMRANSSDAQWISHKLNVNEEDVIQSLAFLQINGHIEIRDGKLINLNKKLTTSSGKPSDHLKSFHSESIKRSVESLYSTPVKDRYFSTTYLVSSRKKIEKANKMIQDFNRKLTNFLENEVENESMKEIQQEVLTLSIQLYPTSCDHEAFYEN